MPCDVSSENAGSQEKMPLPKCRWRHFALPAFSLAFLMSYYHVLQTQRFAKKLTLTLSPDLACISDMPVRLLPEKNDHFDPKYHFSMYNVDCRLKLHVEKEVLFI